MVDLKDMYKEVKGEDSTLPPLPRPVGRPLEYMPEIRDRICEEVALGNSLRTICKADDMPAVSTVFKWLRLYPEFVDQYTIAKQEQTEAYVEELVDIADNGTNDWMATNAEDNLGYKVMGEHIQRAKLRIETRKWIAAKLKAKKYGEKITQEHTGDAFSSFIGSILGKSEGLPND